jgi:hypothetical protein
MIRQLARSVLFGLTVGGILTAATAGAAPATTLPPTCDCNPVPVAVVADSIISRSRDEYPTNWGIWAEGGRSSSAPGAPGGYSGREAVGIALTRLEPDGTLVVELGANDVVGTTTVAQFRAFVDWTIAAAGPGRNVVWVTPLVNTTTANLNRSIELRGAVLAAFPAYPGTTADRAVVDWFAVARYNTWLLSDGVHVTPEGGAVLAAAVVQAVEAVTA